MEAIRDLISLDQTSANILLRVDDTKGFNLKKESGAVCDLTNVDFARMAREVVAAVCSRYGAGVDVVADVVAVDVLPRTASAKVMRRSLRSDYLSR